MAFSKDALLQWRDDIVAEMQRLTKAPGVSASGAGFDNEKRIIILEQQLESVNRLIGLCDGPRAMKISGIDS